MDQLSAVATRLFGYLIKRRHNLNASWRISDLNTAIYWSVSVIEVLFTLDCDSGEVSH